MLFWTAIFLITNFFSNFNRIAFDRLISWPLDGEKTWQSPLATWDAAHYLNIASRGYVEGEDSCAFYPLWPFLIRTFAFLYNGDVFMSGIVLANAISCLMLFGGHKFCERVQGEGSGVIWLLWILCLPGSIFLNLIYTESLFMLLTIGTLYFMEVRRYVFAGFLAFFLPLTKAIGIFMTIPIFLYLLNRREGWKSYCLLLFPVMGYAAYFLVIYSWTGNFFEGFEAQKNFPTKPSIMRILDVTGFLEALLSVKWIHTPKFSFLDRMFFLVLIICLPQLWFKHRNAAVYSCLVGIISVTSTLFISFTRQFTTCFPGIIPFEREWVLGQGLGITIYFMSIFSCVKVWLLINYVSFNWSG